MSSLNAPPAANARFGGVLTVLVIFALRGVCASPPKGTVRLASGAEEAVYVQTRDGCGPLDYPDWSARAFRARDGTITLLDSNSQGYHRALLAPGATAFVRDCNVTLASGHAGADGRPEQYNNSVWLQAFWVDDTLVDRHHGVVIALVHNEFHGERATEDPTLCPSRDLSKCWYANVLAARSDDGGATFTLPAAPTTRAAIASPTRYVPDGGRQGYVQMTNIVRNASDGAWYTLVLRSEVVNASTGHVLPPGLCVWRTANVSDPALWRGWDGAGFTVRGVDPYAPGGSDAPACVATGPTELRFTLVWSDVLSCWLGVGEGVTPAGAPAFVYATSEDLFVWSELAVLRTITSEGSSYPQQKYASVMDLSYAGADANFQATGAAPALYYTRLNAMDDRDLVRQRLEVVVRTTTATTSAATFAADAGAAAPLQEYDLLIYGSTPAGIMCAQAFRATAGAAASIAMVDPGQHVGGLPASGLGNTDVGHEAVIGGFARAYFVAVARTYDPSASAPRWLLEPHVATSVFQAVLAAADVTLVSGAQGIAGVMRGSGASLASVTTLDGRTHAARYFVDASYEGDLLAAAGIAHALGRESRAMYGENVAGRLGDNFSFVLPISPYDVHGALLPLMSTAAFAPEGAADELLQAYDFRLCVTNVSALRVPFPAPAAYDHASLELFHRWVAVRPPQLSSFFGYAFAVAGSGASCCKFDLNSDFAVSFDVVGGSSQWPRADVRERAAIWAAHRELTLSLLYALQHDPATPAAVRAEALAFGLCGDEFVDSGGWPPALYVREARRMVGDAVFTAGQVHAGVAPRGDSVGLGSYAFDVHHVQRVPCLPLGPPPPPGPAAQPPFPPHAASCAMLQPNAPWPGPNVTVWVAAEGHMGSTGAPSGVFELPYSLLLPPRAQASNLLVPVAVSASHVAFNAVRLEPQWMILGHAAGAAAALAHASNAAVQDVRVTALQEVLQAQGALLHAPVP